MSDLHHVLVEVATRMRQNPGVAANDIMTGSPDEVSSVIVDVCDEIADNTSAIHFVLSQLVSLQGRCEKLERELAEVRVKVARLESAEPFI
jgi:hypothetical protein